MYVISNEVSLIIESNDVTLRWDKVNDSITIDSSVSYTTFIKLVKTLKRSRNLESLSIEVDIDD